MIFPEQKRISKALLSLLLLGSLLGLGGCFRDNAIEIDLPEFKPKLMVEGYVEPDSFYRVSLLNSFSYYTLPDTIFLEGRAVVTITHLGTTDTLKYYPPLSTGNFFSLGEYRSSVRCPHSYGEPFFLRIQLGDTVITSQATLQQPIAIERVSYTYRPSDDSTSLSFYWNDPNLAQMNYYRYFVVKATRDTAKMEDELNGSENTDEIFMNSNPGESLRFGFRGPRYFAGDTLFFRMYHIEQSYYDFCQSVDRANAANFSPLTEPSIVFTNIECQPKGVATGIFAALSQTKRVEVVPAKP